MVNVYEYTDYRKFLRDWYEERKAAQPSFSYRVIARGVGFASPGHFTMILKGKTNISIPLALRFAAFIKLRKRQTDYFETLVLYGHARTHDEQRALFEKLRSFKEADVRMVG